MVFVHVLFIYLRYHCFLFSIQFYKAGKVASLFCMKTSNPKFSYFTNICPII